MRAGPSDPSFLLESRNSRCIWRSRSGIRLSSRARNAPSFKNIDPSVPSATATKTFACAGYFASGVVVFLCGSKGERRIFGSARTKRHSACSLDSELVRLTISNRTIGGKLDEVPKDYCGKRFGVDGDSYCTDCVGSVSTQRCGRVERQWSSERELVHAGHCIRDGPERIAWDQTGLG